MAQFEWYSFSGCCVGITFQVQSLTPPANFTLGNSYYLQTDLYSGCTTFLYSGYSSANTIHTLIQYSPSYVDCAECITANPCLPNPSPTPTTTSAPAVTITPTQTKTPTNTTTPTQTKTPTGSVTPTKTPTQTKTPTNTGTIPLTPSFTRTQTKTPTSSITPTNTATPTQTNSQTPTNTTTPTNTITNSITPTNTLTNSITPSNTTTPTNTLTNTPTKTTTKTPLVSFSQTPNYSPTPTYTPENTPTLTPGFGCLNNSYCLFTTNTAYTQYNGTYYNYGVFNGYSLFYSTTNYIYFDTVNQRWTLSDSYGGSPILFGPSNSTNNCPDLNSSIFGLTCPTVTPTSSAQCETFTFSAIFDCEVITPETPTPTTTLTPTLTQTMTPTQICYGKSVDVSGQYISNSNGFRTMFDVTPSPIRECSVLGNETFLSFNSSFYSSFSKLLIDCSNSNNYLVSEPIPFNTGSTFQAIIDGNIVCVTYNSDVIGAPLNVLNSIESGNLYDCRWCSVAVTPTITSTSTLTPTVTKTQTKTPTLTSCLNSDIDFEFITGQGVAGGYVYATYILGDGRILIGGDFTSYRNVTANRLCLINTNGSIDTSFALNIPYIGSRITTISVDETNKNIYIGTESGNIYKLNYFGVIDNLFFSNVGSSFNNKINKLQVVNISSNYCDIVCIGDFTQFNGNSNGYIQVLNHLGGISTNYQLLNEFNGPCNDLVYDRFQKLTIVGDFTEYGTSEYNRIVRLNYFGSIDPSFPKSGFTQNVKKILISDRFEYFCSGDFNSYSGVTSTELIRLNYNGVIVNSFTFDSNNGINSIDFNINQTQLYVGGNFENSPIGNLGYNNLICLNLSGSINNNFGSRPGFNGEIDLIKVDKSNKILSFGNFTSYNLFSGFNRILRLYPCQVGVPVTPTMTITPTTINCIQISDSYSLDPSTIVDMSIDTDLSKLYVLISDDVSNYLVKFNSYLELEDTIQLTNSNNTSLKYYDGSLFLLSQDYSTITIFNILNNSEELFIYNNPIKILKYYDNKYFILSTNSVSIYDFSTQNIDNTLSFSGISSDFTYESTNNKIYVICNDINKVFSLNFTLNIVSEINVGETPTSISVNTENKTLYVTNYTSNSVSVIETTFDTIINTIQNINSPYNIVYNPNENRMYVSEFNSGTITLINCDTLTIFCSTYQISLFDDFEFNNSNSIFYGVSFSNNTIYQFNQYAQVTPSQTPSAPTPTPTPTFTITPTVTPTFTITPTVTPTFTSTPTSTSTITPTLTSSITPTKTKTPTPTSTPVPAGIIIPNVWTGDTTATVMYKILGVTGNRYLVGGSFSDFRGNASIGTVVLDSNGNFYSSVTGANNDVYDLQNYTGNTILSSGYFSTWDGTSAVYVEVNDGPPSYNANGSTFQSPYVFDGSDWVSQVYPLSDGKILAEFNNNTGNSIVRHNINGSFDNTFSTGSTSGGGVITKFAVSNDESQIVVIGNSMSTYSGVSCGNIIALNSNGTINTTFSTNAGTGLNALASEIIRTTFGSYLIGGLFSSYNGTSVDKLVMINSGGTINTSFSGRTFSGGTYISHINELSDGRFAIFGDFAGYDGYMARDFIVVNTDGSLDTSVTYFTTGTDSTNYVLNSIETNDGLICVGFFNSVNGYTRRGTFKMYL